MKRLGCLVLLMVLSSSAHAATSFSFVVGGYRIHLNAPRHCGSPSCVSISIPGIHTARRRDRNEDFVASADAARATTPPQPAAAPSAAPPSQPGVETPLGAAPSQASTAMPPAPITKEAAVPPSPPPTPPNAEPAKTEPLPVKPGVAPPATQVSDVTPPTAPPGSAKASPATTVEAQPATPLGDWRSEGNKGLVRIEPCGKALCGYVLDSSSNAIGESVLVNMKPKSASVWSGNIYSRASGSTYYGTIAMKGEDSLKVEACAFLRFFCSGNIWRRAAVPQPMTSSRESAPQPRS
jgi:uncharacterized protein (DUF2147 family)